MVRELRSLLQQYLARSMAAMHYHYFVAANDGGFAWPKENVRPILTVLHL